MDMDVECLLVTKMALSVVYWNCSVQNIFCVGLGWDCNKWQTDKNVHYDAILCLFIW